MVYEAALDTIKNGDDLAAGTKTGTTPLSTAETAIDANTLTFHATGEAITSIVFADPTSMIPSVNNIASGTAQWALSDGGRTLTLSFGGQAALILALSGATGGAAGADATISVTATLVNGFNHLAPNSLLDVILSAVTVVATDASGDKISGTISVNIVDDAPSILAPDPIFVENTAHSAISEHINFFAGADGVGNVEFNVTEGSSVTDEMGNAVFLNGEQLFYHVVDSHTVQGRSSAANGSDVGFVATLDPVSGTWTFATNGTLFNGAAFNTTTFLNPGGGNSEAVVLDSPGGSPNDMLITANGGNSVNTNNTEWGVAQGNSITSGETIRFDMVKNASTDGTKIGSTFTEHYEVGSYTQKVTISGNGTATFTIRAVNADNDKIFVGDNTGESTAQPITVTVANAGGVVPTVTVNPDGTVTLSNIGNGDTFTIISNSDPFSAVEITGLSGTNTFNLTSPSFTTANTVTPFDIVMGVTGVDGDGDPVSGEVTAKLMPDPSTWQGTANADAHTTTASETTLLGTDGNDTLSGLDGQADVLSGGRGNDTLSTLSGNDKLYGGSGNDSLAGGSGNDILTGGDGDDILIGGLGTDAHSGGTGNDTFNYAASDLGAANVDSITDYLVGDTVDLSVLLASVAGDAADVQFKYADNSTKAAGTAGGGVDGDVTIQVFDGANWQDVAVLKDNGSNLSSAAEHINLILDNTGPHQFEI
ncbi:hypothetical protein IM737_10950 [Devosia sp. SL43]|nr:hypothetical protein IM737_10950 [Devosia sp. SL43]